MTFSYRDMMGPQMAENMLGEFHPAKILPRPGRGKMWGPHFWELSPVAVCSLNIPPYALFSHMYIYIVGRWWYKFRVLSQGYSPFPFENTSRSSSWRWWYMVMLEGTGDVYPNDSIHISVAVRWVAVEVSIKKWIIIIIIMIIKENNCI